MGLRVLTVAAALALAGCSDVDVLSSVTESDAHRAVATLDRAGVSARFERTTNGARPAYRVHVPSAQVARAVAALSDDGLPRRDQPGFAESWGDRSLVTTRTEERARAAQAIAGELSRSIESIDGVIAARVHLSPGSDPELSTDSPRRPTASTLILHATATPPVDEARVRALISGAVEGMRPEDVTVIFARRAPRPLPPLRATHLGAITVTAGSGYFWGLLGALTFSVALLFGALVTLRVRGSGRPSPRANS